MTNIFTLSNKLTDEDRFTAQLHYLIECVPAVGQRFVDILLAAAGRPSTRFERAEDHPNADAENRPDFLLVCEDFDIVCEHKLQSPLGEQQLERYLKMRWHRPAYIALISASPCAVSAQVCKDDRYLRPKGRSHYRWSDIYPAVHETDSRLSRDFVEYMHSLRMRPLVLPNGWNGLFEDRTTAEAFGEQLETIRSYFGTLGCRCTTDADRRGLQVSQPLPWLHLLYFHATPGGEATAHWGDVATFGGRIYAAADAPEVAAFQHDHPNLSFGRHRASGYARDRAAGWNAKIRLVHEYVADLNPFLSNDADTIKASLLEFARGVFEHARIVAASHPKGG